MVIDMTIFYLATLSLSYRLEKNLALLCKKRVGLIFFKWIASKAAKIM